MLQIQSFRCCPELKTEARQCLASVLNTRLVLINTAFQNLLNHQFLDRPRFSGLRFQNIDALPERGDVQHAL